VGPQLEHVVTALEELGQRHIAYGAKVSDLSSLGEALMIALEAHDPNPWDDLTRQAWHSAYDSIPAPVAECKWRFRINQLFEPDSPA
jgi:hemoglobin-like flavoprotein